MKITRDNYESWFLDYLEGHLEEGMAGEFHAFLSLNPDLQEELEEFREVRLHAPEFHFAGKERLFRDHYDLPGEFETAAVARLEGDLTPEEAAAFDHYLGTHPGKKEEAALFELTRLTPDERMVFPARSRLMRQPAVVRLRQWSMRAAAILLTALLIYTLTDSPTIPPGSHKETPEMAARENNGGREGENSGKNHENILPEPPATIPSGAASGTLAETRENLTAARTSPSSGAATPGRSSTLSRRGETVVAGEGSLSGGRRADAGILMATNAVSEGLAPATHAKSGTAIGSSHPAGPLPNTRQAQAPALVASLQAHLSPREENINLASITSIPHPATAMEPLAEPLAQENEALPLSEIILEKTGLADLTVSKVTRWGLRLATGLSGEKFRYHTNSEGEITALNLETRLLGLSIPVSH